MSGETAPGLPSPEDLRRRLDDLRGRRGFLLPHHGALAAAAPDLHAAYLRMYEALTLTDRHLSPFEREFVWLAVLATTRESVGTHHLDLFRRAGGTDAQAGAAFQLAAYGAGAADTFAFVETAWSAFYPDLDARAAYSDGVAAFLGDRVPPETAGLALAAVHAAHGSPWGVAVEIEAAYASGVREEKLVEALSLVIWPVGVNKFLDACTIWHDLMGAGRVRPSPRFQAWADTPAQGRFEPP